MRILGLELSSASGGIVLLNDGDVDFFREWSNDRKNSGPFFEHLAEVQKKFGKPDTIIVGLGPGSYAGTRIAISAAIGLSFGGRTPVSSGRDRARPSIELIGYPSICAVESDSREYCVIGDARRSSFSFARVRDNDLVEGFTLMTEAELHQKLDKLNNKVSIFAFEKLGQFDRASIRYPSAKVLAQLATDSKRNFAQPPLEPIYLREPHITIPKK
jgi:tRNA threonylcarbamoyladenosine biosynthesis protein TsaB